MDIREVKIEEYWPLIVKGTEEFGQIAVAENPEFNALAGHVYDVLKDSFIKESTEYGVSRWEKMLGLAVTDNMTLEDRRAAILTHLTVKLPYTWRVLKQMLTGLLGEDNFEISLDNDTQTMTIGLASTVENMREKIDELCARVIPQNLVIEYNQGLPIDYTPVEYLSPTALRQCIQTDIYDILPYTVIMDVSYPDSGCFMGWRTIYLNESGAVSKFNDQGIIITGSGSNRLIENTGVTFRAVQTTKEFLADRHLHSFVPSTGSYSIDGVAQNNLYMSNRRYEPDYVAPVAFMARNIYYADGSNRMVEGTRIGSKHYNWQILEGDIARHNWVPALDPTGAPCMFDLVTRMPFYNSGTGDFTYPTETTTYALRRVLPDWGKMTEHGLRRLYHTPSGYTGELYDYALENGYKPIIEPEQPEEGCWAPRWTETDDEIVLEWIETVEEVIENE